MKRLLISLLATIAVAGSYAQSFEGTIRWHISIDITDPKILASIAQTKKEAADTATRKKVADLRKKMSDPAYKAFLDGSPDLRAQYKGMIMALEGASPAEMVPNEMVLKLKLKNTVTIMKGGIEDGYEVLYLGDKNEVYRIYHDTKKHSLIRQDTMKAKFIRKVSKTVETMEILGYKCTKYFVEISPWNFAIYWATDEIEGVDTKTIANHHMGKEKSFMYPEVDGVPLRIESRVPQGTYIMEAIEVKKEAHPAEVFQIPAGYVPRFK